MKRLSVFVLLLLFAGTAGAQDVREAARQAAESRARADERAAAAEAAIIADRAQLTTEVARLESEQARLERGLAALQTRMTDQEARRVKLAEVWATNEVQFKEISGNVRLAAKEVEILLHQSPLTADDPTRLAAVRPLLEPGYFPDIDDISGMAAVVLDEIRRTGEVAIREGTFVGRDGQEATGQILSLGRFTSAYRLGDETGFLDYSPESGRYVALATLPRGSLGRDLRGYFDGKTNRVPIDISAGGALRQVAQQESVVEHFLTGGPLMWPILGVAVLALLIVLYKFFYLQSVQGNTRKIMDRTNELVADGDWQGAEQLLRGRRNSPVGHVLSAGLEVRDADREIQESVLQEAILNQLPTVERGMAVLAVLGAVAPLLGLLGTVTGMIDTFRVITLYGTGDPKLMSGGISAALITTEYGLYVCIPIMLLHTLFTRRVESIVADMEERAVQLCNVFQTKKHALKMVAAGGA